MLVTDTVQGKGVTNENRMEGISKSSEMEQDERNKEETIVGQERERWRRSGVQKSN